MILAKNGIIPSEEWEHDPELKDNNNETVAMQIAYYCKQVPPDEWDHNPNIRNIWGDTVEYFLKYNNIRVPPEW